MIAKIAYDVHIKNNLSENTIPVYVVPDVINDSSIISSDTYIPNSKLLCNSVKTSRGVILHPNSGNSDNTYRSGNINLYDCNGIGSFKTIMYADDEMTFDFFDPTTETFVPWTLYCGDVESGSSTVMELKWKDANGNPPPTVRGISYNYIARSNYRTRHHSMTTDGICALLNFDGFAFNPFSNTDPIVARLSVQAQIRTNTYAWTVYPKMSGGRTWSADGQYYRSMPYQFPYRSGTYDLTDPIAAKCVAFGMTNWVKLHDDFKQYISYGMTETLPDFEYQKYLEFGGL